MPLSILYVCSVRMLVMDEVDSLLGPYFAASVQTYSLFLNHDFTPRPSYSSATFFTPLNQSIEICSRSRYYAFFAQAIP